MDTSEGFQCSVPKRGTSVVSAELCGWHVMHLSLSFALSFAASRSRHFLGGSKISPSLPIRPPITPKIKVPDR
jgi:hypothetical protein